MYVCACMCLFENQNNIPRESSVRLINIQENVLAEKHPEICKEMETIIRIGLYKLANINMIRSRYSKRTIKNDVLPKFDIFDTIKTSRSM